VNEADRDCDGWAGLRIQNERFNRKVVHPSRCLESEPKSLVAFVLDASRIPMSIFVIDEYPQARRNELSFTRRVTRSTEFLGDKMRSKSEVWKTDQTQGISLS